MEFLTGDDFPLSLRAGETRTVTLKAQAMLSFEGAREVTLSYSSDQGSGSIGALPAHQDGYQYWTTEGKDDRLKLILPASFSNLGYMDRGSSGTLKVTIGPADTELRAYAGELVLRAVPQFSGADWVEPLQSNPVLISLLGQEVKEVIVAYDALAVIVNPGNPVSRLTRAQLEAIFRGKITNWKQVGGEDRKIVVYSRETSSGTYEFFKESVLGNKNYMSSILSMPATGAIIQSVRQTPGAIGYVGLAYLNPHVKALSVAYEGGGFYAPTVTNSMNGKYPIVRPLYYYYNVKDEALVRPFIDYLLSPAGQKLVRDGGFVPLK